MARKPHIATATLSDIHISFVDPWICMMQQTAITITLRCLIALSIKSGPALFLKKQSNQEQDEGPPPTEQDQGQDKIIDDGGAPNNDQDHVFVQGQSQDDQQVLDGTPSS